MKSILVIATGGTIASAKEGSGLAPALTGEQLVTFVPEVAQVCRVEVSQVMNVDSTNMRPQGRLAIAAEAMTISTGLRCFTAPIRWRTRRQGCRIWCRAARSPWC